MKNRRVGEFRWLLYGRLNHPRTTAPQLTQLQPRDRTAISLKSREDADAALFARTFWRYYYSFIQRSNVSWRIFFTAKKNHKYICVYTWYICLLLLISEFILGRLLRVNYVLVTVTSHECDYRSEISRFLLAARKNFCFAISFFHRWTAPEGNGDGDTSAMEKSREANGENDFHVNSDLLSSSSLDVTH